jgi:hypothetical protein
MPDRSTHARTASGSRRVVASSKQQHRHEIPADSAKRIDDLRWSEMPEQEQEQRRAAEQENGP